MILNDTRIAQECRGSKPMIEPFYQQQVRAVDGNGILSYGLSSFGYDLTAGLKYKIFTNANATVSDPKALASSAFIEGEGKVGDAVIIPPNSFLLTYSQERLIVPRNVLVLVVSKSTYARIGVHCLCTPLEPEWEGHVTLEFVNGTPLPAKFYLGEGCCQALFLAGDPCGTSYKDKGGKYMHQGPEVVLPTV